MIRHYLTDGQAECQANYLTDGQADIQAYYLTDAQADIQANYLTNAQGRCQAYYLSDRQIISTVFCHSDCLAYYLQAIRKIAIQIAKNNTDLL
jgi:hypothetical protein